MILILLLIGIIVSLPIYYTIQDNRYYKGKHNREVNRALRQINKSRRNAVLTGTTTEHWVNMCKEIEKED